MFLAQDFPDRLPAVMIKEMRQSLRSRSFTLTFATYHILLIVLLLISFSTKEMSQAIIFCAALPMLIIPALHAGDAINSELRENTLQMLFLTRLDSWRIVTGKWLSASLVGVLFLTSALPYAVARYFIAKGNFLEDVLLLCLLCLLGSVMAAFNLCMGNSHPNFAGGNLIKKPRGSGLIFLVLMFIFGPILLSGLISYRRFAHGGHAGFSWDAEMLMAAVVSAPLVIFLMLKLAAAGMAPASENHVRGRRICVFLGLVAFAVNGGFSPLLALIWSLVLIVDLFAPEGRSVEAVRPLTLGRLQSIQQLFFAPRLFSALSFHFVCLISLMLVQRFSWPDFLIPLGVLLFGTFLGFVFRSSGSLFVLCILAGAYLMMLFAVSNHAARVLLWVPIILAPLGVILHFAYRQHVILILILAECLFGIFCIVTRVNPFESGTHVIVHFLGFLGMIPLAVLAKWSGDNHHKALALCRAGK
ncbi:MAG: hypothetical protein RL095_192 [Verrucomicrobiota bacterium]|jgi:hypothetical protein